MRRKQKRRPTVHDRDVSEAIARLRPGEYKVLVEQLRSEYPFNNLATLKPEGGMVLWMPNLIRVTVIPLRNQS